MNALTHSSTGGSLGWLMSALILTLPMSGGQGADPPETAKTQAPPDHQIVKRARGGHYFVAKRLKAEYDQLLARVTLVKKGIEEARTTGAESLHELRQLQADLHALRQQIEAKKVFVSPLNVVTRQETIMIKPGASRLLVISADDIQVRRWDGPEIKCVLEKTILSRDANPPDADWSAIRVVHRYGRAPDLVGRTRAELQAEEQKFLATPEGKALTPEQRRHRDRFYRSVTESSSIFHEFQGQEIDTVEIEGLTHEQGNRQLILETLSKGGNGASWSDWQRHASLTVFVPACRAVALRGGLVGLRVTGLKGSLVVADFGARDIDYDGTFQIKDVEGNVSVRNAPLQLCENIRGNVVITATVERANTGETYRDRLRTLYTPAPRTCVIKQIRGDVTAWFNRVDLTVEEATGKIDVRNEFGNTVMRANTLPADKAHRIVTESGAIDATMDDDALARLSVSALTDCGTVMTNRDREKLDSISFSGPLQGPGGMDLGQRHWHGVRTRTPPGSAFPYFERTGQVLAGSDRSPGLDLISRAGTIRLLIDP